MNKVCVLGSINMDVVLKVNSMPQIGQTIISENMAENPGGKGANQAVSARRSGSDVYMIGKIGMDGNGEKLLKKLLEDGINIEYVFKDKYNPTGTAIITVDNKGNNEIIVVPGANMNINDKNLEMSQKAIFSCDALVAQFEVPVCIVERAFKIAREHGKITILNPSPASNISDELMENTDILIPNETEVQQLTNISVSDLKSAEKAGKLFIDKKVRFVVITLGEIGAAIITKDRSELIPAYKVKAIDTTAAGDSFLGAFVSSLDIKNISFDNLKKSVKFANQVSSLVVQKKGAQPSIPYLKEVNKIYGLNL